MAIVRKYGKPDLFITFTCNPRWPEIADNLAAHSTVSDRPELVAGVFHMKLRELIGDITVNRVFGNVLAYVYTIEFQKRGLPHAHILIIQAEDMSVHGGQQLLQGLPETIRRGDCVYVSDGGYPKYRRPDDGQVVLLRNHEVGNEFVSPPEGIWWLYSYELHKRSHTIVRLPVHLEGRQNVYFEPGQAQERLQNEALRRTGLTEFFVLNVNDVEARQYLYTEIKTHHKWNAPQRTWARRRRLMANETLARMYIVNPLDRDRFHLRLLLLNRRGPQSFQDIRTVDGVVEETYTSAAVALGLLEDDRAWRACLTESAALDTPRQLRYLFVTILVFCEPSNPLALYEANEANLMEDFNRRLQDVDRARAACLNAIGDLLRAHGKSLGDYGLPLPDPLMLEPEQDDRLIQAIEAAARWAQQLDDMNAEQRTVFDRVMAAVDDGLEAAKTFYVDGPGGTGKTNLYGCLIWSLRNSGRSVLCVAFTGIAASLMDGGMTVHSTFGTMTDDSTSTITMQSERARKIRDAALIVWDVAPMSPGLKLTVVDQQWTKWPISPQNSSTVWNRTACCRTG
ncbi:uncharacterized protein LOC111038543 [Myzus persicae]|uniref:uncharacterized protein LOC111038543 n=1 Tax=Myzus persicae TaxID=13164 RepID=UPI000B9392B3|nr:uncharacterized protein LOC111038543 [Myzus persicae]